MVKLGHAWHYVAYARDEPEFALAELAARRARLSGSCGAPGTVLSLDTAQDGGIEVACGEGSLLLTRVVPEGKAPMSAADYIRGRRLSVGERLG